MGKVLRAAVATVAGLLVVLPAAGAAASPLSERQWWFDSYQMEDLVWTHAKGRGVTVGVISTGVNAKLPDLRDAVVPGKSFVSGGGDGRRDTEPGSEFGYGTGMASLIASRGVDTGFTGMAPESKILPIAIPGIGDQSAAPAIRYAVDNGADVITIPSGSASDSYPHQCPRDVLKAVTYAAEKDVVVVAAAGNYGDSLNTPQYPGSCPGVVAVGAFDNQGNPWESTQQRDYVTLSAAGVNIAALSQDGRVWPKGEGTGHAAAIASGAFALLRSKYPDKSARQIVQLATNTAKDFGSAGRDDKFGYGALSPRTALTESVPDSAPNPVYERLDAVRASASADGETPTAAGASNDGALGSATIPLVIGLVVVVFLALLVGAVVLVSRPGRRDQDAAAGSPPPAWAARPGFAPPRLPQQTTGPQETPAQALGPPAEQPAAPTPDAGVVPVFRGRVNGRDTYGDPRMVSYDGASIELAHCEWVRYPVKQTRMRGPFNIGSTGLSADWYFEVGRYPVNKAPLVAMVFSTGNIKNQPEAWTFMVNLARRYLEPRLLADWPRGSATGKPSTSGRG